MLVLVAKSYMVFLNDGVEKSGKQRVGLSIRGVDANAGIWILNT